MSSLFFVMPGGRIDTLVPWKVWGRYEDEATKDDDDHQVAHVDFGFIVYEYEDLKRVFDVKQIHDAGGIVEIRVELCTWGPFPPSKRAQKV